MKKVRGKKEIEFNYDSLADIVSNILGILIILGVMVGMIAKSEKEVKNKEEKELINGKRDALTDIINPDKRLKIPYEREARYNRFHVHIICFENKLYFVDTSELSLKFYNNGYNKMLKGYEVGDCSVAMSVDNIYSDVYNVTPIKDKGLVVTEGDQVESFRSFFKLLPTFNEEEKRANTQLLPNNHAIHFHVFPNGLKAFKSANSYLRMLGFDTGWCLYPDSQVGSITLPAYLQKHENVKSLLIQ